MLTRLDLRGRTGDDLASALARPDADGGDGPLDAVREIIADVRKRGDDALRDLTARFDGCPARRPPGPPGRPLPRPGRRCRPGFREALEFSRDQIMAYHRTQVEEETRHEREGIVIRNLVRPVDRAGCYVPGGRAVYPSTVLMTAIPAQVAGVPEIALCVPPGPDGTVPQATLAAAALLGLDEVYRVGGAQAIAAMAYGTETIRAGRRHRRPRQRLRHPGQAGGGRRRRHRGHRRPVGAGGGGRRVGPAPTTWPSTSWPRPSTAPTAPPSSSPGRRRLADDVAEAIDRLLAESSRRADTEATLRSGGAIVLVDGPEQAMEVANIVAPEHLELMNADPAALVPLVRHAGAVFCGQFAPAAVGDYVAGVNHVLPTARTARFSSAPAGGQLL